MIHAGDSITLIEAIGLPGAGKSHLTQRVLSELRRLDIEDVKFVSREELRVRHRVGPGHQAPAWKRWFRLVWLGITHPHLTWKMACVVARIRPLRGHQVRVAASVVYLWSTIRGINKTEVGEVPLLEEGFVQTVTAALLDAHITQSEPLADLFKFLNDRCRFCIIVIETPVDEVLRRLQQRPQNGNPLEPFKGDQKQLLIGFERELQHSLNLIYAQGGKVIRVRGDSHDDSHIVQEITQWVLTDCIRGTSK